MSRIGSDPAAALYLDLLKRALTFALWGAADGGQVVASGWWKGMLHRALLQRGIRMVRHAPPDPDARAEGRDWPAMAHTMIGLKRLNNLQSCMETALRDGVPGDFIETGVWRGGATVFMRGLLKAYGITDRKVFVADSFEGLPKPNTDLYPADAGDKHHEFGALAVSLEQVQEHFRVYGLLDDQVRFLKGWFKDTLPAAPIDKLAVARLDGDMYESTMDAIQVLYPKLSPGGFLIVDDYHSVPACAKAIHDYRDKHGIKDDISTIDWSGAFWRKS